MRKALLSFLLLQLVVNSFSQDIPEFEGRIHYRNSFILKKDDVDTNQVRQFIGTTNVYSYKQGNYLWTFENSVVELELYLHEKDQLLNKYRNKKFYISGDVVTEVDSLITYEIKENADTICGYVCKSIKVVTQRVGTKNLVTRTLYYNPEIAVDPEHFKSYKSYAHWKVYQITRSVPLKIVMDDDRSPFIIVMEAEKVEKVKVSDKEFRQNKSFPVKTADDL
jgi:hypothetical protein